MLISVLLLTMLVAVLLLMIHISLYHVKNEKYYNTYDIKPGTKWVYHRNYGGSLLPDHYYVILKVDGDYLQYQSHIKDWAGTIETSPKRRFLDKYREVK